MFKNDKLKIKIKKFYFLFSNLHKISLNKSKTRTKMNFFLLAKFKPIKLCNNEKNYECYQKRIYYISF